MNKIKLLSNLKWQFLLSIVLSFFLCQIVNANPIKTIRFATEATYPPFEFIDEAGKIQGFDIDIANALCQQLQAQCTFSNQSFNSLIPSLKLGKFDALIAALGITAERKQQVNFTDSYYEPSASFVAASAKHYTIDSLSWKTVGVQQGSTFEKYLHDKFQSITPKTYASVQDAFLDLIAGRVDAVIADTPIAQSWLKQNDNSKQFTIIDKPLVDHTYFGTGYGIALRKNDSDLQNSLNKALATIKANGTYNKIIKKYFSY